MQPCPSEPPNLSTPITVYIVSVTRELQRVRTDRVRLLERAAENRQRTLIRKRLKEQVRYKQLKEQDPEAYRHLLIYKRQKEKERRETRKRIKLQMQQIYRNSSWNNFLLGRQKKQGGGVGVTDERCSERTTWINQIVGTWRDKNNLQSFELKQLTFRAQSGRGGRFRALHLNHDDGFRQETEWLKGKGSVPFTPEHLEMEGKRVVIYTANGFNTFSLVSGTEVLTQHRNTEVQ